MPPDTTSHFRGCLLGLALGDALAVARSGGLVDRLLWIGMGRAPDGERRGACSTQMTMDVVASLVRSGGLDQDHLARRLATSFQRRLRYHPTLAKVLQRIGTGERWEAVTRAADREGSRGNGAAVRVAPIGLLCALDDDSARLEALTRRSAAVTHSHPQAQSGALLIAQAIVAAVRGGRPLEILERVEGSVGSDAYQDRLTQIRQILAEAPASPAKSPATRARRLGNSNLAIDSCATALFLALAHLDHDFETLIDSAVEVGGHVEGIAAMAGAIWGAANGVERLPAEPLERLHGRYEVDASARDILAVSRPEPAHARSA